ncbi:MAG: tetratricopeptide repeat protein [Raineya sp.]|nr:tetratricopeptide repeat protein [Raineya sp.]
MDSERIEAYIKEMMRLKERRERENQKADLKAIAKELGMDEADFQAVEEERKKMIESARGLLNHQQCDDAISLLETAYNLEPDDAETISLLAQAYGMKYIQTNNLSYKKKSEEFASMAILKNPQDQRVLELLRSVRYKPQREFQFGKILGILIFVGILASLGYWLFSSNPQNSNNNTPPQGQNLSQTQNSQEKQGTGNSVSYTNFNNETATFEFVGAEIIIRYDGTLIKGKTKTAEKNKYADAQGTGIAEVKVKDSDGFKVRTPDGQTLLWKIKLAGDKIKISDNEENRNPYEIKRKENKMKITKNDTEIAELKGKNKFSEAVMYLTEIPKPQRYIIVAELLMRNL